MLGKSANELSVTIVENRLVRKSDDAVVVFVIRLCLNIARFDADESAPFPLLFGESWEDLYSKKIGTGWIVV